jgi:hypothetical protein
LSLLLELLFELVGEILGQILLELLLATFKSAFNRQACNAVLATLGYLILGAVLGAVSLFIWPDRVTRSVFFPGLSMLLGPLAAGFAMHAWGQYRLHRGHVTTFLATFYGGAAFALGVAVVRLLGT